MSTFSSVASFWTKTGFSFTNVSTIPLLYLNLLSLVPHENTIFLLNLFSLTHVNMDNLIWNFNNFMQALIVVKHILLQLHANENLHAFPTSSSQLTVLVQTVIHRSNKTQTTKAKLRLEDSPAKSPKQPMERDKDLNKYDAILKMMHVNNAQKVL